MRRASHRKKKAFINSLFFLMIAIAGVQSLSAQAADVSSPGSNSTTAQVQLSLAPLTFFDESKLSSFISRPMENADNETKGIQVRISTNPTRARIEFGDFTSHTSPLEIDEIKDGEYWLTIRADGYKPFNMLVKIQNGYQYLLDVVLASRDGYIGVKGNQQVQILEIDGNSVDPDFPIRLREGYHSVRARSFGYRDFDGRILVNEGFLSTVNVSFSPAAFEVTNHSRTRDVFRPANPGKLGQTSALFEVSASGHAAIVIYDPQGRPIHEDAIPQFATWQQAFVWSGRDSSMNPLSEGTYPYSIVIHGDSDDRPVELSGEFIIDNSSIIAYRTVGSGASGFEFVSDSLTLPEGAIQLGVKFGARFDYVFPLVLDFGIDTRFGVVKNLELAITAIGYAGPYSGNSSMIIGGSLKYALLPRRSGEMEIGMSAIAGGAGLLASGDQNIVLTVMPGVFAGIVADIVLGPFGVQLEPLFQIGPHKPDGSPTTAEGSWVPRLQASAGISFTTDYFAIGLSARTWVPDYLPVRAGANIQWLLPEGFAIEIIGSLLLGSTKLSPSIGLELGYIN